MTAGLTYAKTKYRGQLVGNDSGAPLDQALRLLPGNNLSNAPELVATGSVAWTRSEEHTSELQSLMRSSYAFFCLKKNTHNCARFKATHYTQTTQLLYSDIRYSPNN